MDDLRTLATVLAKPEPPRDVIDRGRRQLQEAVRGRPRRHRPGWLAGGLGLAAAAVTVGVVIASGVTAPPGHRGHTRTAAHHHQPAVTELSGRQILLAAAATVAKQRTGTYWHFKIRLVPEGPKLSSPPGMHVVDTYESWIARDGRWWNAQPRCAAPPGTAVFEGPGMDGFSLGKKGGLLTYRRTRRLPTDPAALTAWFARYEPSIGGDSFVAGALIALQYQVPAPPAVRAAAFRALAAFPHGATA